MSARNIITSLYPCYISQLLIGCAPIKITEIRSNLQIKHRRVYDYSTILILLLIISFIYYRYSLMDFYDFNSSALVKFMTTVYFVIVSGLISTNVIYSRVQRQVMTQFLYKIYTVDKKMRNIGIKLKYENIQYFSTKVLLTGFATFTIYLICLLTTQGFQNRIQGLITYGLLYLAVLHYISSTCSFMTTIQIITNMAENLMKKTEDLLIYKSFYRQIPLREMMKLHQEIYDLLQLSTKIFAAQVLFSFSVAFVIITFQSFSIICAVYNNSPYLRYSIASAIWIVVFVTEKMVLTFSCHKCMFRSIELRQKLGKYAVAHSKNKLLVKEVCGTATTYIILLLQTDHKVDLIYSMKKVFGVF
ncbi:uncharacterized protein LOC107398823 [Tribolium castaneum]|uniref:uncharacterized protein LOC107398823 n=1 Tax=Tribolium castaneum TaxID=7070 RepID=UPI0030FE18C2